MGEILVQTAMKTHEVATITVRTMFDTMDVPVSAKQMSQVLLDEVLERFDAPLESFPFMPNYYQGLLPSMLPTSSIMI